MSFDYTCYFILTRKTIDSSLYGDISGSYTKTEIDKYIKELQLQLQLPTAESIISDITSNQHIVGIPTRNL